MWIWNGSAACSRAFAFWAAAGATAGPSKRADTATSVKCTFLMFPPKVAERPQVRAYAITIPRGPPHVVARMAHLIGRSLRLWFPHAHQRASVGIVPRRQFVLCGPNYRTIRDMEADNAETAL